MIALYLAPIAVAFIIGLFVGGALAGDYTQVRHDGAWAVANHLHGCGLLKPSGLSAAHRWIEREKQLSGCDLAPEEPPAEDLDSASIPCECGCRFVRIASYRLAPHCPECGRSRA